MCEGSHNVYVPIAAAADSLGEFFLVEKDRVRVLSAMKCSLQVLNRPLAPPVLKGLSELLLMVSPPKRREKERERAVNCLARVRLSLPS